MRTSLLLVFLFLLAIAGCGGTTNNPCTAPHSCDDASARDAAAVDVDSGAADSGTLADAGEGVDASASPDAFTPSGDAGVCVEPGLGDACGDTAGGAPCPAAFDCDLGRCLPQGRETCGGFAGAPCDDPVRTECTYETGHGDVGTCFSPSELRCLCATDPSRWSCG